jgi:hypothetical protein
MNTQEENRAMETVEKHNCRFSTDPTAPTAADNQQKKQPTKNKDDRLHKMLDATELACDVVSVFERIKSRQPGQ